MPLLFTFDQRLIVSSAALLTSLILVSRKTLLQAAANGLVRSDIINGLCAGAVGRGGNPSLVSSMPPDVVPGPVNPASAPPSLCRGNYLPTQSQASYHSVSSSPSAHHPFSGFYCVNEEADVRGFDLLIN